MWHSKYECLHAWNEKDNEIYYNSLLDRVKGVGSCTLSHLHCICIFMIVIKYWFQSCQRCWRDVGEVALLCLHESLYWKLCKTQWSISYPIPQDLQRLKPFFSCWRFFYGQHCSEEEVVLPCAQTFTDCEKTNRWKYLIAASICSMPMTDKRLTWTGL